MAKRIFLDSNHWIILARVFNGKEKDPILVEVFKKIKELSDSGDAIFPFSLWHLEDILKNTNKIQKYKLIDFMIDISKGWVMKPFLLFRHQEIENAILRRVGGKPSHDIKSEIIAKGVAYTAGKEYHISSKKPHIQKFLDEHEHEWREKIDSIESMTLLLKDDNFSSFIRKGKEKYISLASKLETNRTHRKTWKKSKRYDNEIIAYFSGSIEPHLTKFLRDNNCGILMKFLFQEKKDFELFLEYMPSSNVFVHLTYARDEESPERKIQANDQIDINHLSGAIPYCDIVVMEKMFASLSKKLKLDEKYDCCIFNSLKELNSVL